MFSEVNENLYALVGILGFVFAVFAGRFVLGKAGRLLSPDENGILFRVTASLRVYGFIPVGLIILVFFALPKVPFEYKLKAQATTGVLLAAYFVFIHILTVSKMRQGGVPETYLRSYNRSRVFWYAGFVILFAGMAAQLFWHPR